MTQAIRGIHHVAILTDAIELAAARWIKVFGASMGSIREVDRPGIKLRTVMLSFPDGTHVQLIEPHQGPGVHELAQRGPGTIYELALATTSIRDTTSDLEGNDLVPVGLNDEPLDAPFATAASGSRYLYLRPNDFGGTRIELLEPAE